MASMMDQFISALGGDDIVECERLVSEEGADITVRTENGRSLIHVSSQISNTATLDWILSGCVKAGISIEDTDKNGATPLVYAVMADKLDNCRWLLEKGANIAMRANDQRTLLLLSSYCSKSTDTLAWVLKEGLKVGLSIEDVNKDGYTPLLCAAASGKLDNVKWLLTRGADLNARTNERRNILHVCSDNGHSNVLKYSLDLVPIDMINEKDTILGLTPVLMSSKYKHFDCVRLLATKALQVRDEALAAETKAKKEKAAAEKLKKICCSCGITFGVEIQSCACFRKRYCSTTCQAADWAEHKADCIMWRREMREAERAREAEEEEAARKFDSKPCSQCGNSDGGVKKYPCAACNQWQYCCRECQVAHWKSGHREECKEWRRKRWEEKEEEEEE